jgi:hypothetical protein
MLVMAYSWFKVNPTLPIRKFLRYQVTGDDYLYATSVETFTPDAVTSSGNDLGLVFDGGVLRTLSESSFCQHRFVKVPTPQGSGKGLLYVSVPDPTRVFPSLVFNRCQNLYETQLMVQSLKIEHFYNEAIRIRLTPFLTGDGWLTDNQIHKLHTMWFRFESSCNEWSSNYQLVLNRESLEYICANIPDGIVCCASLRK